MRILIVHNFYRSEAPSGEDVVVVNQLRELLSSGHKVELFSASNDSLVSWVKKLQAFFSVSWSLRSAKRIGAHIRSFKPDVVHVHSLFPLLSASVVWEAKRHGVPVVLTMHNYRAFCLGGIPERNGRVCFKCVDQRNPIFGLVNRCYRGSFFGSLALFTSMVILRALKFYSSWFARVIVLTEYQKRIVLDFGVPECLVSVIPNRSVVAKALSIHGTVPSRRVVFVGRLGAEKGIRELLEAWREWGKGAPKLTVVGDGPLREHVVAMSKIVNIEFVGQLPNEEAVQMLAGAELVVVPSTCIEGFPMVIAEAMSLGVPLAVSNIGPLPSIIESNGGGVTFDPYEPQSLIDAVTSALTDENLRTNCSQNSGFDTHGLDMLIRVYESVVKRKMGGGV